MEIQRIPGSEYQVVPEVSMGEVAEIIMGQSPPGATYNERGEGVPFFQGAADFGYRRPSPRVYCTAPTRMARPGDILLSVRAPIGRVNVADQICAIGRGLTIVRAKRSEDSRYLECVLRLQEDTWRALESSGSVFGNATKVDLETLRLPWRYGYPPDKERRATETVLQQAIQLGFEFAETLPAVEAPAEEPARVVPFRRLQPEEVRPYENSVPLFSLEAAAGGFGDVQQPEPEAWVVPNGRTRPGPGLFVARVVGESTNRRIPNGAYCVFRYPVEGSREGRVVLVQHRDLWDPDTGGSYTVKVYRSAKVIDEEGKVRRTHVLLEPDSSDPSFQPIVIRHASDEELRVMAEVVEVLPGVP